jgi:hypothetical protein
MLSLQCLFICLGGARGAFTTELAESEPDKAGPCFPFSA